MQNFWDVIFNPVAQAKFVHTVSAGYVTGSIFVLAISAYFLLRGRNVDFAKRSMTVAISFGLASALSVVVLGDESGYIANDTQHMKIAAMEAMWHTEKAPADLLVFGVPDRKAKKNSYEIKIPFLLGLIATRSFNRELPGIVDLVNRAKGRIKNGIVADQALRQLQIDPNNSQAKAIFRSHESDWGYGLLLKRYVSDLGQATPAQINKAAWDTVPKIMPMFWAFRLMVSCGVFFIVLFAVGFFLTTKRRLMTTRWYLWVALFSLPLPWLAAELGWFVAEYGRQPWIIEGMLPTFLGVSSITSGDVMLSLAGFILFYTALAVVEIYLMAKYIRLGPDGYDIEAPTE